MPIEPTTGTVENPMVGSVQANPTGSPHPDHPEALEASADQPAVAGEAMIRLVDVHVCFGAMRVLCGVSVDLYRKQTTVIVGPSGTGKSVLLKCIAGLLKPQRGAVYFDGQRVDQMSEPQLVGVRKKIGFLFQMGALFDSMTVEQNICFPLIEHTALTVSQRRARCERALRLVGLSGIGSKMPAQLSGGQQKRVALARAVVLEPEAVLYDEPTTGLDPVRADVINELIVTLGQQLGITSVVVTHDMASANKIAHRMIMLYDGQVIADGQPSAFHRSKDDLVQRFINGRADQEELDRIHQGFSPTEGS